VFAAAGALGKRGHQAFAGSTGVGTVVAHAMPNRRDGKKSRGADRAPALLIFPQHGRRRPFRLRGLVRELPHPVRGLFVPAFAGNSLQNMGLCLQAFG
jgi:hypothetical protein